MFAAFASASFFHPTSNIQHSPSKHSTSQNKNLHIVLMLPFNAQLIERDSLNHLKGKVPQGSLLALEYYEGVLLALDSQKQKGMNITLHVYDTYSDSATVRKLFLLDEVHDADLIIGPVYPYELLVATQLAKQLKIPLFSPIVAASNSFYDNPYYYICNSTLRTHCETIADYISLHDSGAEKVFMLYRESNPQEMNLANFFIQHDKEGKENYGLQLNLMKVTEKTIPDYFRVDSLFDSTIKNIVIIPSMDEYFVNTMVKNLYGLSGKYQIKLFGMPKWKNFTALDNENLETLSTIISASSFIDDSSAAYIKFDTLFTNKFDRYPTDFSVQGYDLTLFIGTEFSKYGRGFEKQLAFTKHDELADTYSFIPKMNMSRDTTLDRLFDYNENENVKLIQYKNGKLVKVN